MKTNTQRRNKKIVDEGSDSDSDWEEDASSEERTGTEGEEDERPDSWDQNTLLTELERRGLLLKKGRKGSKVNKGVGSSYVPKVASKRKGNKGNHRTHGTHHDKTRALNDLSRVNTKVSSRSPNKAKTGQQQNTKNVQINKAKDIPTTSMKQLLNAVVEPRKSSNSNQTQSGTPKSQYNAPQPNVANSPSTPREQQNSNSPLPRLNQNNFPVTNTLVSTLEQPNFQLIRSERLQTQPQNSNVEDNANSHVPFIETDFSQPPESCNVEVALQIPALSRPREDHGKQFINVDEDCFDPDITRDINRIVIGYWRGSYLNWNQVPTDVKDMWWAHFANSFEWEPHMESAVNKLFRKKVSAKIRNFVSRAKLQGKKPSHVTIEDWEVMKTKFKDTKYVEKCEKVQVLRKKKKDEGESTYCGGSINANEHRKRLALKLRRQPTVLEVFTQTHKTKDGEWSGRRAEEVAATFEKLEKAQKNLPDTEKKNERELWMEAVGGPINGRVFGLGFVGTQKQSCGPSSSSQMCVVLTQLNSRLEEKDTIIATQQEEIHALTEKQDRLQQAIQETNREHGQSIHELKTQMEMMMRLYQGSLASGNGENGKVPPAT